MVRLFFLLLTAQLLALPLQAAPPEDPTLKTPDSFPRFPAVEPADVASTFVVQAGFQMQLIAAEPLVTDPVAMTIDERGRALVVEMNDYPYTNAKTHVAWQDNTTDAPIGRIRLLEDSDGDGTYDRSTLFAEGLSWPSGIVCYRGGVFVTATPDIWYLKDNDGDGRADVREKIFTGFRKYNVQAVMNNPIWGLDNHLYVAGSSNGGSVLAAGQSQAKPIAARGDFRIDPRTNQLELQAGGARFGNAIDYWGNRFLCKILNPAIHVVLDNRYLARNPDFAAPTAIYNIAESGDQMPIFRISPVEPWRDLRGRQWSADPTKKVPRSELTGGGVFTSTSGINVYRGSAYPPAYQGQIFVAEVANNVIYRQKVEADGNTFLATRADANAEFVASTDTWFRPVNLYNAPDGTLYVLDMYREFIEHPWSIPDDIHARLDLTSGRDRGRIYRLAPANFKPLAPPDLSKLTSSQLVAHLAHANSWYRETAQRLLVERGDTSIAKELRAILPSQDGRAAAHA
ncbi:MAG: dehydrogenase, partial [Pirellulaceae bacterium]|nr:dehydrogenase [Pirellulaceae bacterium]